MWWENCQAEGHEDCLWAVLCSSSSSPSLLSGLQLWYIPRIGIPSNRLYLTLAIIPWGFKTSFSAPGLSTLPAQTLSQLPKLPCSPCKIPVVTISHTSETKALWQLGRGWNLGQQLLTLLLWIYIFLMFLTLLTWHAQMPSNRCKYCFVQKLSDYRK